MTVTPCPSKNQGHHHSVRQGTCRIEASPWSEILSSGFLGLTSLRPDAACHPGVTSSSPLSLMVFAVVQSARSMDGLFLQTFITSTINILTQSSSFISFL